MHDIDTFIFFKWVFKTFVAVMIITNTFNIVMAVFDLSQYVVSSAAGVIISDTSIDISSVIVDMEPRLMEMELGPLLGLWLQSMFIGITMYILSICIFIVIYGRMIEIYLFPCTYPFATMKRNGKHGTNYLRSLFALGFKPFSLWYV